MSYRFPLGPYRANTTPTIPPSYIQVCAIVWECGEGQTDTRTCMTNYYIHFAFSMTHSKCNYLVPNLGNKYLVVHHDRMNTASFGQCICLFIIFGQYTKTFLTVQSSLFDFSYHCCFVVSLFFLNAWNSYIDSYRKISNIIRRPYVEVKIKVNVYDMHPHLHFLASERDAHCGCGVLQCHNRAVHGHHECS